MTTYTKIRKYGVWGLKGENLTPGQEVIVSRSNGDQVPEVVGEIITRYGTTTIAMKAKPTHIMRSRGDVQGRRAYQSRLEAAEANAREDMGRAELGPEYGA